MVMPMVQRAVPPAHCSFCGCKADGIGLIAGPASNICEACVGLCVEIVKLKNMEAER